MTQAHFTSPASSKDPESVLRCEEGRYYVNRLEKGKLLDFGFLDAANIVNSRTAT
jgi:hypothetical protein